MIVVAAELYLPEDHTERRYMGPLGIVSIK